MCILHGKYDSSPDACVCDGRFSFVTLGKLFDLAVEAHNRDNKSIHHIGFYKDKIQYKKY